MVDEQFVDFYQILELPLDADRNTVRKRINTLYLDAQGNLDHRNFATRLRYQELFEATLPQARFVLLDDARRAEYTALVRVFRAPATSTSAFVPPREAPRPTAPRDASPSNERPLRAASQNADANFDARGAQVEPLPDSRPAARQLEMQREELWKKWKIGLEDALAQERGALQSTASADNRLTRREPTEDVALAVGSRALQETLARQKQAQQEMAQEAPVEVAGTLSLAEIEARRATYRRELTRETLVNVSLIWSALGALLVVVPGVAALVTFMGRTYPRGGRALLSLNPNLVWLAGFVLIGVAAFFVSRALSHSMRSSKESQLAALSYEELVGRAGKS